MRRGLAQQWESNRGVLLIHLTDPKIDILLAKTMMKMYRMYDWHKELKSVYQSVEIQWGNIQCIKSGRLCAKK